MPRPNILWLMSDQHNAGCLGSEGHPDVQTPHLDALAAEGVRFTQAFCNNPICAPSRACFLTGQAVRTHGISGNSVLGLRAEAPNLAAHFRAHGYQTALVGKAHLPRSWVESGFEHVRLSDLCDADPNDPLSCHYFAHLVENGLADLYENGALFAPHPGAGMRAFESAIPSEHSLEAWTGDEALRFLQERDRERPFLLKVSFQRPHDPLSPARGSKYLSKYLQAPENISLPPSARDFFERRFRGKPEFQREYIQNGSGGYPYRPRDEDDLKRQVAHYFALISEIDEQIGRLLKYLRAMGEYENTLVCYVSDHGDFAGEHGLSLKNLGIYESIHRIPFLCRWPEVSRGPSGEVCDEIIESIDLFPTLCAAAVLPVPAEVEGRDLLPIARGEAPGREHTVCEWDFVGPAQATVLGVRTASHRLVYYLSSPGDGELYDRASDPGEVENLFHDEAPARVRGDLTRLILSHVARFGRRWGWADDARANAAGADSPTAQIQRRGAKWSQIEPLAKGSQKP